MALAIAMGVLSLRGLITLIGVLEGSLPSPPLLSEIIILGLSVLCLFGWLRVAPLLKRTRASHRELQRLNRALRMLSECNQAVIRAREEGELLDEICRLIVEVGGYRFAWAGFKEEGEEKRVRPVARAGHEAGYLEKAIISWGEGQSGQGPTGTAIRSGQPSVARWIAKDPRFAPWRQAALARGYQSSVALPLLEGERVIGALNIYSERPDAFDEDELRLLAEMAGDLSFGLQTLRQRERQRQAEAQVRALQAFNESILQSMAEGVVVESAEGYFTYANRAAGELLGRSPQELVGMHWTEVVPEDQQHIVRGANQRRARGMADSYELELQRRDGSRVTVLVSGVPRVQEGRFVGSMAVFVDISARKRAEQEVQRRSEHLETLNAIIADAASADDLGPLMRQTLSRVLEALDLDMGAFWIAGQQALAGLPEAISQLMRELAGGGELDLASPIAVENWALVGEGDPLDSLKEAMGRFGIEASLTVPIQVEGKRIGGFSLASPRPRTWQEEEIRLVEAVGQQVGSAAQRLALLETVRRQAELVQHILDTVKEGILHLDGEGRVLLANPAGQRVLEMLAKRDEEGRVLALGGLSLESLSQPRPDGLPHEVVLSEAGERIFEVHLNPEPAPGDRRTLLVRDVSEARRVQKQMEQQGRLAAVGQLAAGIAHDFNNIIGTIILYSELALKSASLPARTGERLEVIFEQAQRAADLIQQILDFSRRSVMKPIRMDLQPFLKEFSKLLMRTLPETIQISLHMEGEGFYVEADPGRIEQMLMNLALNARDAMPQGGKLTFVVEKVHYLPETARPWRGMSPGEWLLLRVEDTGVGIEPEVMPHIFEPFFTTKEPGEGTGLGLSQVYGIVRQHGGFIDVQSTPGSGTQVRIYLPAVPTAEGDLTAPPALAPQKGGGEWVLVVEDDPATRAALREGLEALNYHVILAESGDEALALFERQEGRIDLVLTDLVMPGMGGIELYRALRKRHPGVRVVMITGYPLGGGTRELLHQQNVYWLQKPISLEDLAHIVRRALDEPQDSDPH
jgi:PAS domain S-box-containing protein